MLRHLYILYILNLVILQIILILAFLLVDFCSPRQHIRSRTLVFMHKMPLAWASSEKRKKIVFWNEFCNKILLVLS